MKDILIFIYVFILSLLVLVSALEIKDQAQKINELEKGVLYFSNEADKLRAEQDKQARLIAQDLIIYANGFDFGK